LFVVFFSFYSCDFFSFFISNTIKKDKKQFTGKSFLLKQSRNEIELIYVYRLRKMKYENKQHVCEYFLLFLDISLSFVSFLLFFLFFLFAKIWRKKVRRRQSHWIMVVFQQVVLSVQCVRKSIDLALVYVITNGNDIEVG